MPPFTSPSAPVSTPLIRFLYPLQLMRHTRAGWLCTNIIIDGVHLLNTISGQALKDACKAAYFGRCKFPKYCFSNISGVKWSFVSVLYQKFNTSFRQKSPVFGSLIGEPRNLAVPLFGQNFRFVLGGLSRCFNCSIPRARFASYHHTRETLKRARSCTLLSLNSLYLSLSPVKVF